MTDLTRERRPMIPAGVPDAVDNCAPRSRPTQGTDLDAEPGVNRLGRPRLAPLSYGYSGGTFARWCRYRDRAVSS